MKYIVILADGMADYPVDELGGKTPMQVAHKPNMDALAAMSEVGLSYNVPANLSPGSDVANLSAMGYNPQSCYTGRSPLEAVSMGIDIKPTDMIFRCNVVTITEAEANYEDKIILDHSADEISTEEARELILAVNKAFGNETFSFYPGVSYRHALVWDKGPDEFDLTPPHDILEKRIGDYLPKGENGSVLCEMMKKSYEILNNHPINLERAKRGLKKANTIWIWGEGRKPALEKFETLHGINGSVISAVDLIKGIGICAGLESIDVEGATGNIHTNFDGKAKACLDALRSGSDYVFVHMEAPDECGHRHEVENKVKSIEIIDEKVVGFLMENLEKEGIDYRMMILPDHPTPLCLRTHTRDAVPYLIYDSTSKKNSGLTTFTEETAKFSGIVVEEGYKLMDRFIIK
ncbi:MAG: cofactor-independent phosphoglycerate mutase [Ruminococcaceae bacterium]|nr:cofactor-independent phosphoglycerate mutase [Oscillospiraceae bacterium]